MSARNIAARYGAQAAVSLAGAWLVWSAARANEGWILRHLVVPNWFVPPMSLRGFHLARAAVAVLGFLTVVLIAPRVGNWAGAQSAKRLVGSCARIAAALFLSVLAAELALRHWEKAPFGRMTRLEFGLGRADPRLGWVLVPSRSTLVRSPHAPAIHYNIGAWGNRARSEHSAPDPTLPTLIVTGESIALGYGLEYPDTFAGILGDRLGLQVVNVSSSGYAMDQAYLRLVDTLERLEHPVAVLTVFHPIQLARALQDYRPRLVLRDGALAHEGPASGFWASWRLRDLLVNEVPYLSDESLSRTMALNAAIVRATSAAARSRGAEPLFVVPIFGSRRSLSEHPEAPILRQLFERQAEPYLLIDIERSRMLPDNLHPDAVAARQIAAAAEAALLPRLQR